VLYIMYTPSSLTVKTGEDYLFGLAITLTKRGC
jgi:hypothetical protein